MLDKILKTIGGYEYEELFKEYEIKIKNFYEQELYGEKHEEETQSS
ncbi:UNVERIFIED_CONTAM: hypothetical protein O8I53_12030 [Campylobacter lari]